MRIERDGRVLRLRLDGDVRVGRVHDLSGERETDSLDAVRDALGDSWVVTRDPPPVTVSLARVARSHGLRAPQADRIDELTATLDGGESRSENEGPKPTRADGAGAASVADESASGSAETDESAEAEQAIRAARRRVAETGTAVERLRERVATLRGRLAAEREAGETTASVEAELERVTRELTEAETEQIAARESLDRRRRRVRERRDERERRLRRHDELRNRRREARAWLADRLARPFHDALRAVRIACDETDRVPDASECAPDAIEHVADHTQAATRAAVDGLGQRAQRDTPDRRAQRDTSDQRATRDTLDPGTLVDDPVTGRVAAIALAADDAPVVLAAPRDPVVIAVTLDRPVVRV